MLMLECVESFTWTHSIIRLLLTLASRPVQTFRVFELFAAGASKTKTNEFAKPIFFLGWLLVLGYMWAAVWTMNNMQSLLRALSLPNKRRQRMKIHYIAENWIYLSFIISGGSPKHESKQHGKSWCFELCASNVYLDMLEGKQQKL